MCKASGNQSALFIATGDDDDDANVLVVGGGGGSHNSDAATTLSSTSDQFFSNWRSGPNQTPSILHGPSFQMKGPGRTQPFHEPNRKPTDFSRLILAPVMEETAFHFIG